MEGAVLHRVVILGLFSPKQGQIFKPSGTPLPPRHGKRVVYWQIIFRLFFLTFAYLFRPLQNVYKLAYKNTMYR